MWVCTSALVALVALFGAYDKPYCLLRYLSAVRIIRLISCHQCSLPR